MTSTEKVRAWRKANPEKAQAAYLRYRKQNKTRIARKSRAYHKKHAAKIGSRVAAWRAAKPDQLRDTTYRRLYGLTLEQYNKMIEAQNHVCAVCLMPPKKKRLCVDHDHKSKQVRGGLCFYCNKYRVGRWRKEHLPILERLVAYLKSEKDWRQHDCKS